MCLFSPLSILIFYSPLSCLENCQLYMGVSLWRLDVEAFRIAVVTWWRSNGLPWKPIKNILCCFHIRRWVYFFECAGDSDRLSVLKRQTVYFIRNCASWKNNSCDFESALVDLYVKVLSHFLPANSTITRSQEIEQIFWRFHLDVRCIVLPKSE
jgi:hypothetical protein